MGFSIPQSQVDELLTFGTDYQVPDADYGQILPSRSNVGFGLSDEAKKRLEEALTIGVDRLVSRINPGPSRINPTERTPDIVEQAARQDALQQVQTAGAFSKTQIIIGLGLAAAVIIALIKR